jgi:nitrogen fixation protein FixH
LAVIGGIGLTMVVNGAMIWQAIATFPGKAGRDGFELSNRYNAVLERERDQAAIGIAVRARVDSRHRAVVTLIDAAGRPLPGLPVAGTAERPVGDPRTTLLAFADQGDGSYVADLPLDAPGQWDVTIEANSRSRQVTVTRRLHVP